MAYGMADSASQKLRQCFSGTSLKIESVKESANIAFGNGSGLMWVMNDVW